LISRFLTACQEGDVPGLVEVLAEDITVWWSDGGGKALAALRPIYGVQAVTRLWLGLARKVPADLAVTLEQVNGAYEVFLWMGGSLNSVMTCEIVDERIQNIRSVLNRDKLAYIQQQARGY
jgi:RNA polymerase sigma-70 factor, ECF subfamily